MGMRLTISLITIFSRLTTLLRSRRMLQREMLFFTLGFQGMRLLVVLVQGTGNPALFCGFGKVPALSSWACWIILVVVVEPHTVLKL